jgi:uncharacterized protein (TIGR00661 family)
MKILYGVVGEGMGHATRSKVVLTHLVKAGHDVTIVVSGRAHDFLKKSFPTVIEIAGLRIAYEGNQVNRKRTFGAFLKDIALSGGWAENLGVLAEIKKSIDPEVVISDFESAAYLYGQRYEKPVLSIDNMQIMNRCKLDVEIPKEERVNFQLAKGIVKSKLPGCHHYLITTFFFPEVRKERTSLFPPILRDEVIAAKPRTTLGEHVIVYQTSDTLTALVPTLQAMPKQKFLVYGLKRNEALGNVTLKDFSEKGFIDDLASARGVITGGGFSLMSEAVFFGKPILSFPIAKQFEQVLNALYLEKLGYGVYARELSPPVIAGFLEKQADLAKSVARHEQKGNEKILAAVDGLLAEIARTR